MSARPGLETAMFSISFTKPARLEWSCLCRSLQVLFSIEELRYLLLFVNLTLSYICLITIKVYNYLLVSRFVLSNYAVYNRFWFKNMQRLVLSQWHTLPQHWKLSYQARFTWHRNMLNGLVYQPAHPIPLGFYLVKILYLYRAKDQLSFKSFL